MDSPCSKQQVESDRSINGTQIKFLSDCKRKDASLTSGILLLQQVVKPYRCLTLLDFFRLAAVSFFFKDYLDAIAIGAAFSYNALCDFDGNAGKKSMCIALRDTRDSCIKL